MSGMVMVGCGSVVDSLSATRIALTEFNNGVFSSSIYQKGDCMAGFLECGNFELLIFRI